MEIHRLGRFKAPLNRALHTFIIHYPIFLHSHHHPSSAPPMASLPATSALPTTRPPHVNFTLGGMPRRRMVVVRAEGGEAINPAIRKSEDKVVDSVVVADLAKPLTPYCRYPLFLKDYGEKR